MTMCECRRCGNEYYISTFPEYWDMSEEFCYLYVCPKCAYELVHGKPISDLLLEGLKRYLDELDAKGTVIQDEYYAYFREHQTMEGFYETLIDPSWKEFLARKRARELKKEAKEKLRRRIQEEEVKQP